MNVSHRIPIFPLGVVLLPKMTLPLHIFEERYKEMTRDCLEKNQEFGVVFYDGTNIKSVGCTASIRQLTREYGDGRMDIMTEGKRRFEIENIFDDKSYLQAAVHYFDDFDVDDPHVSSETVSQAKQLLKKVEKLTKKQTGGLQKDLSNPQDLSFYIAGVEGYTSEERQEFLEMESTAMRLEKGVEALSKLFERIKLNQEIERIVSGNGHLPELYK